MKKYTQIDKVRSTNKNFSQIDKVRSTNKNFSQIDKPLVSILMAVYNSNEDWLKEQLISLNNQSYDNLELLIYDDCPQSPLDEEIVKKYITKTSYKIFHGKENLGSNKAFEILTTLGKGRYFSYCDQDDIWDKDKIDILVKEIEKQNFVIAYCDMRVIDAEGNITGNTLLDAKPRIKYLSGDNLFAKFFFKNCVSGCCMLIDSEIAKKAVPFSNTVVHDQWLCTIGSLYGKISFIDKPLMKYRIHGNNQTGSLKGICNKKSYYDLRILPLSKRLEEVKGILNKDNLSNDNLNLSIKDVAEFCNARINRNLLKIFHYRYLNKMEAYFEIIIKYMPDWIFKLMINKLK